MPLRYVVRRGRDARHYSVWDNERNRLAIHEGRECTDLDFQEAFHVADKLNAENKRER